MLIRLKCYFDTLTKIILHREREYYIGCSKEYTKYSKFILKEYLRQGLFNDEISFYIPIINKDSMMYKLKVTLEKKGYKTFASIVYPKWDEFNYFLFEAILEKYGFKLLCIDGQKSNNTGTNNYICKLKQAV